VTEQAFIFTCKCVWCKHWFGYASIDRIIEWQNKHICPWGEDKQRAVTLGKLPVADVARLILTA